MALNKTPGVDGLPSEFYIENWDAVCDAIVELYKAILERRYLPKSQKQGIITLILKSNDSVHITN